MKKRYILVPIILITAIALTTSLLTTPTPELSPEELQSRVENTRTDWANYQEDLKGQIGSTPVAKWKGHPTKSTISKNTITVTFNITGYWAQITANLPVIIRDPLGKTHHPATSTKNNATTTYTFKIPQTDPNQISWIQLKYPHNTRRITYTNNTWEHNQNP